MTTPVELLVVPGGYAVSENNPNPLTPELSMLLGVDDSERVTIGMYDAYIGSTTRVPPQIHNIRIEIPTEGLAPGAYVVRIEGDRFATTRSAILVR